MCNGVGRHERLGKLAVSKSVEIPTNDGFVQVVPMEDGGDATVRAESRPNNKMLLVREGGHVNTQLEGGENSENQVAVQGEESAR